jgi:hypothetical protein
MPKREKTANRKRVSKTKPKRDGINRLIKGNPDVFLEAMMSDTGQNNMEFICKKNADGPYETIAVDGEEIDMGWRPFIDKIPQSVLKSHYANILSRIDKLINNRTAKDAD